MFVFVGQHDCTDTHLTTAKLLEKSCCLHLVSGCKVAEVDKAGLQRLHSHALPCVTELASTIGRRSKRSERGTSMMSDGKSEHVERWTQMQGPGDK